ncbi:hypothetical protein [Myxococcus xanthus]|nr:hypothetical protein [Myxococcus xanthus]
MSPIPPMSRVAAREEQGVKETSMGGLVAQFQGQFQFNGFALPL